MPLDRHGKCYWLGGTFRDSCRFPEFTISDNGLHRVQAGLRVLDRNVIGAMSYEHEFAGGRLA